MSQVKEYELISTEIEGEIITFPVRYDTFSTFCRFDQLQGIVGNNGGKHFSKADSCYIPAKQLLKKDKNQSGHTLVRKLTPPKNTNNN